MEYKKKKIGVRYGKILQRDVSDEQRLGLFSLVRKLHYIRLSDRIYQSHCQRWEGRGVGKMSRFGSSNKIFDVFLLFVKTG
jgi:hypothetical protein